MSETIFNTQESPQTPVRHKQPSPLRIRVSPDALTPTKRVRSLGDISDQPPSTKRLHLSAETWLQSENVHFPHVELGFSLMKDGIPLSPSKTQLEALKNAFPTAIGIGVIWGVLTIHYRELPPKPWPVVVAGIPAFLTTKDFVFPFKLGRLGGPIRGLNGQDARAGASNELFMTIVDYLERDFGVTVHSILNLFGLWAITISDNVALSDLPCQIAKSPCYYIFENEVKEPTEAAVRGVKPDGTTWDSSTYETLRPGVMFGSGKDEGSNSEFLTTSGVKVRDNTGRCFITAASHGLPKNDNLVYHPDTNGQVVGRIVDRIPETDIALISLSHDKHYENETFSGDVVGGTIDSIRIQGVRTTDLRHGDVVSMNNPFTGYVDGLYVGTEFSRIPTDEATTDWTTVNWVYFGNGIEPVNGSCGSAILDENGYVVSFFRFMLDDFSGLGIGTAASTLLNHGYHIA